MSRNRGQDAHACALRSDLEAVVLALIVDWQEVEPLVRLRIEQAVRRDARLGALLNPVLDDLTRMSRAVADIKSTASSITERLMKR
jgi:hypothetical protein